MKTLPLSVLLVLGACAQNKDKDVEAHVAACPVVSRESSSDIEWQTRDCPDVGKIMLTVHRGSDRFRVAAFLNYPADPVRSWLPMPDDARSFDARRLRTLRWCHELHSPRC